MKRVKVYIRNIDKADKTRDKRTHVTCMPKVNEKPEDRGFDAMYQELIDKGHTNNKFN